MLHAILTLRNKISQQQADTTSHYVSCFTSFIWCRLEQETGVVCLQHFVNTQMMVHAEPKLLRTLRRSDVHS